MRTWTEGCDDGRNENARVENDGQLRLFVTRGVELFVGELERVLVLQPVGRPDLAENRCQAAKVYTQRDFDDRNQALPGA